MRVIDFLRNCVFEKKSYRDYETFKILDDIFGVFYDTIRFPMFKDVFRDCENGVVLTILKPDLRSLIDINKTVGIINNDNKNTVFDFKDIDEDDSYLVLKYGKILLEEIE